MFSLTYLHEAVRLRPGDLPEAPISPQEMRKGIARVLYNSPLIRHMAEYEGWTGEDKYTALAFYVILRLEEREFDLIRRAELEAHPMIILKEPPLVG